MIDKWLEREEDLLWEMLEAGEISQEEYQGEINALYREARGALEEEAQRAYDDVIGSWCW